MSDLIKSGATSTPTEYKPPAQNVWVDQYLDESQSEISRYLRIIFKRKWLILGLVILSAAATAYRTFTTKPLYMSTVKIQIDPEESILPYRPTYSPLTENPLYLGTQTQVLKSQMLALRIVKRLDLVSDPAKANSVARWFAAGLQVAPVAGTQVVTVSYTSESPEFAAKAVNALADEYIESSLAIKQESTVRAKEYLEQERAKLKEKLDQSEQALIEYGRAHGILMPTEAINVQKLTDLNQEMTKVEAEILSSAHVALGRSTPDTFPQHLKTEAIKDLERRLAALRQRLSTAVQQFGPKWPEVVLLNDEIAVVEDQRAEETQRAAAQAKQAHDLAVAHRGRVAAAMAEQNRQVDLLSQASIQYGVLKREVESNRQLHEGLSQRLKETDVSAGLKAANIHVIDRGVVPTAPFSPNVPRSLGLGLALGLMGAVGIALAADFFDNSIKNSEDVERDLRLPFLGEIPAFEKSWAAETGGLLARVNGGTSYVTSSSYAYWESYRRLRTALLFSTADARPKTILVTSAMPGEGKTTTAVNLATVLAQTGARTLLLELDMRKPRLADIFQTGRTRGISRYLSGQSDLNTEIQGTGIPNVWIIPAGPAVPNPPELIGSTRMEGALDLLAKHFQYVVIDAPPLVPVTDVLPMARRVDGVLLVVQAGKTPKALVQKARNLLRSVDARIFGALMTQAKLEESEYGHYQNYYDVGNSPEARAASLKLN